VQLQRDGLVQVLALFLERAGHGRFAAGARVRVGPHSHLSLPPAGLKRPYGRPAPLVAEANGLEQRFHAPVPLDGSGRAR